MNSFNSRDKKHSTILLRMYIQRRSMAAVSQKDGLGIVCLSCQFDPTCFDFHPLHEMAHGWKPNTVGSRQMGKSKVWKKGMPAAIIWFWIRICAPKQKTSTFLKAGCRVFVPKIVTRILMWTSPIKIQSVSICVWLNLMASLGMPVKAESSSDI